MDAIGTVKQVQVQRSSLKIGERGQRLFDPSPLFVVERLLLQTEGCIGITADGEWIVDVHHQKHSASRNRGDNMISLNFTTHYQTMRDKFGDHLKDGCAGENILIETTREFTLNELHKGIALQSKTSGKLTSLIEITIATPCLPFSQFAAQYTHMRVKEPLQFLDNGRRGFYAAVAIDSLSAEIQAGDAVFAL